jgi:hypothetical protein
MVISADWLNQNEHINMLKIAAEMICGFLKLDFEPVIVVDTFGKDKINPFLKELYRIKNDLSVKIFGLYVTDEELKRRLELRPNDMFKDFLISKELNDEIIKIKNENEILFDTTCQTAEETAQKIYDTINS